MLTLAKQELLTAQTLAVPEGFVKELLTDPDAGPVIVSFNWGNGFWRTYQAILTKSGDVKWSMRDVEITMTGEAMTAPDEDVSTVRRFQ